MSKPIYTDEHSQSHAKFLRENPIRNEVRHEVVMRTDDRVIEIEEWLNEHCPGRFKMLAVECSDNIALWGTHSVKVILENDDDFTQFSLRWL